MTPRVTSSLSIGALAALVLTVAACGGDESADHGSSSDAAATVTAPDGSTIDTDDVMFAQGMIPHHEQAIEMSEIALDPTVEAGATVRDLATRIQAGQDPEIQQMTAWLQAWGQPMQMDMSDGHEMDGMEGMMTADEMAELGTLRGAEFDQRWLEMMIRHHEGAITMAETVTTEGSDPDVRSLAAAIITAQQGEIAEMQALLGA